MSEFGLIESFDIDDGQLDDLTQQEIFVLGYELALISWEAETYPEGINRMIHIENKERIEKALIKRGRKYKFTFPHDDISESWVELLIEPKEESYENHQDSRL